MSLQQQLGTPWHYEKVGALDLVTPRAIGMSGSQALRAGDGPHQSAFAVGTDPNCSARIPPLQPLFCRHAGAACKNGSRFQKGTMARRPRIVLENVAHHVVARGVGQMQIFRSGFDKRKYLKRFTLIADEEHVTVLQDERAEPSGALAWLVRLDGGSDVQPTSSSRRGSAADRATPAYNRQ